MSRRKRLRRRILTPIEKFIQIESFSGILLFSATVIALVWANSPAGESYLAFWQYKFGLSTPVFELKKPLLLWVNDGLMAIFFFLIGLEIKRELLIGELNSLKKMAFPAFGALGGMSVPVLLYFLLNQNPEATAGWGIPMATDIAFSLAILKLLGNRVPLSLKIFMTAFAIVDDLGAVLVIAIFYSGNIELIYLLSAIGLLLILYLLSYYEYYSKFILLSFGVVVWVLFLKSGIHPTLAGILLAFSVPIRQKIPTSNFIEQLADIVENIKNAKSVEKPILSKEQITEVNELENWIDKYQSPLQSLEHRLHDWVAYAIIPIFALANAGVVLNSGVPLDTALVTTITACLVLGNSIGITSIVLTAKRLRWLVLPPDINRRHIVGASFLAGVGFTMSIFIASLAFKGSPTYIDSAKVGILIGSFISGAIGYGILRFGAQEKEEAEYEILEEV